MMSPKFETYEALCKRAKTEILYLYEIVKSIHIFQNASVCQWI